MNPQLNEYICQLTRVMWRVTVGFLGILGLSLWQKTQKVSIQRVPRKTFFLPYEASAVGGPLLKLGFLTFSVSAIVKKDA